MTIALNAIERCTHMIKHMNLVILCLFLMLFTYTTLQTFKSLATVEPTVKKILEEK